MQKSLCGWVVGGGWVVCKVILVFRFGPRLGLKTEDLGQAEHRVRSGFAGNLNKITNHRLQLASYRMKNTDRRQNKSLKTSVSFSTSLNIIIVIARCIVEIKENFKNMLFFENGTGKLCICSNSPDSRTGIPRILFCSATYAFIISFDATTAASIKSAGTQPQTQANTAFIACDVKF